MSASTDGLLTGGWGASSTARLVTVSASSHPSLLLHRHKVSDGTLIHLTNGATVCVMYTLRLRALDPTERLAAEKVWGWGWGWPHHTNQCAALFGYECDDQRSTAMSH